MSVALVLGNGESRLGFVWQTLTYDYLIGCNAIHRNYTVDHLICCDRRMVTEAVENINNQNTSIYVRQNNYQYFRKIQKHKNIKQLPDIPYHGEFKRDRPDHWGSGPYAVLVASTICDDIILLGFDLYGNDDKINNVYKDTVNYNKSDSAAVDPSYWVHQIAQVIRYTPYKTYTIINDRNWQMPKEWALDNVVLKNFEDVSVDNKYLCS